MNSFISLSYKNGVVSETKDSEKKMIKSSKKRVTSKTYNYNRRKSSPAKYEVFWTLLVALGMVVAAVIKVGSPSPALIAAEPEFISSDANRSPAGLPK
jgi:hypothetical protein